MKTSKLILFIFFMFSFVFISGQVYAWHPASGDFGIKRKTIKKDNRTKGFNIRNESNKDIYAAVGHYRPQGWTGNGWLSDSWFNKGWHKVKAGTSKIIYSKGDSTIYVYIEKNGTSIIPRNSMGVENFCIHPTKGFSSSREAGRIPEFSLNKKRGNSCRDVGGKMVRFYKMKTKTNFTVR